MSWTTLHPERGDRGFQRRPESADGSCAAGSGITKPDAINNPDLRENCLPLKWISWANDVRYQPEPATDGDAALVSTDGSVSSVEAVPEPGRTPKKCGR